MNSVALPAAAVGADSLASEADLVRQGARGDAEALGELFRRHSAIAWRLAQAVTSDTDAAREAFVDGFVRAVRSGRLLRRSGDTFRPHLLASVYRVALDRAHDRPGAVAAVRRSKASPELARAETCFRTLPERWRAAVWLTDVEHMDSTRVAAVLGVSAGVAEQLVARGRRGLAGRYAQAHAAVPERINDLLRQTASALPAGLADATAARWSVGGMEPLASLRPVPAWLNEHGIRPLSVATGILVGLGLIGVGVVGGGGAVRSQLGANGTTSLPGAIPVSACVGASCPPQARVGAGAGALTLAFDRVFGLDGTGPATPAGGASSGLSGQPPGTVGGTGGDTSGDGAPGGGTPPGGGTLNPPGPGNTGIALPANLGTVTFGNGSVSASLLGGTASVTAGTCGASVQAGSAGAGTCRSSSTSSGTGAVLTPLTGAVHEVVGSGSSAVSSSVSTVSGTASKAIGTVSGLTGHGTSSTSPPTEALLPGL